MMDTSEIFKLCSSCRKPIPLGSVYWACNVSTCNRKRTGLFFCSVPCWEAHLPMMRHREAWAVEQRAPARGQDAGAAVERAPAQRKVVTAPAEPTRTERGDDLPREVLIVASKLKKYIKARSGMNTSDGVLEALSDHVRSVADEAIRNAGRAERRTVLERDIPDVGPKTSS